MCISNVCKLYFRIVPIFPTPLCVTVFKRLRVKPVLSGQKCEDCKIFSGESWQLKICTEISKLKTKNKK